MITVEQLSQRAQNLHDRAAEFASLDLQQLNYKPGPDSWSILECLEHLNRYSRYYNPALAKAIAANPASNPTPSINYSWLGKKSLDMVRPENMKKHKTVKHMNPNNSHLGLNTIQEFLQHQHQLLHLLHAAIGSDLNKKAIPVEFFKLLKLRIGETLEFVIVHQERHLQQALRVKEQVVRQAAA